MNLITIIDFLTFWALFANALLYIPQIRLLIKHKNARDVSLTAFLGFDLINFIIMLNGLMHNNNSLFWGSLLSFISNSAVVGLIIYYRARKEMVKVEAKY